MSTLFEFGQQFTIKNRKGFEEFLCQLWKEYKELWPERSYDAESFASGFQPFFSFDGNLARPNNFIGFIQHDGVSIEIYPKVFQRLASPSKESMHCHLFYWFSYCRKIKFPFNQSYLDNFEIEQFPELIIYLLARQINQVVTSQPYLSYEEIQETLLTPRGKINFSQYTKRLSYGTYHLIDCDYEPFVFDNGLNRVIKYCSRLLLSKTRLVETQRILNDTIFLLDEVDDQVCSLHQLNSVRITALFQGYEDVIRSCKMILQNQIYSHAEYEMTNWSLLFPMEYVFEDFLAGFIQDHFSDTFYVEPQKSDLYLHYEPNTFNIKHDILLTHKVTKEKIIVDTKYKPRWDLRPNDNKKGVSQFDLYQMISYAYRRGTNKVLIIYPNTSDKLTEDYTFKIPKAGGQETINIKIVDVPFWSATNYKELDESLKWRLTEAFKLSE